MQYTLLGYTQTDSHLEKSCETRWPKMRNANEPRTPGRAAEAIGPSFPAGWKSGCLYEAYLCSSGGDDVGESVMAAFEHLANESCWRARNDAWAALTRFR